MRMLSCSRIDTNRIFSLTTVNPNFKNITLLTFVFKDHEPAEFVENENNKNSDQF